MANKKKKATAAIAITTAAALLLGGTFAWQSISQTALNEKEEIINPGGRLHNDQNWISNKKNDTNIYVENFTDPEKGGNAIYARVRLEEYMEIVMNYGTPAETVTTVTGSKTKKDGSKYNGNATKQNEFNYTYVVHKFGAENQNATDDFWTWETGSKESEAVYYMPTFNKNKDSLLADLNGVFDATVGGFSNSTGTDKYDYEAVTADTTKTANAVYDADSDTTDGVSRTDLEDLIENGEAATNYEALKDNVSVVSEDHAATTVGKTNGLLSMTEWHALNGGTYSAETHGNYWVYDTDGWVYWSSPIKAGETTGLLLDSIELKQVMDDTYYYAINVVGQFITADDLGEKDKTGFYADGGSVSNNALTLLKNIGVDTEVSGTGNSGVEEDKDTNTIEANINIKLASGETMTPASILWADETYSYNAVSIADGLAWDMENRETPDGYGESGYTFFINGEVMNDSAGPSGGTFKQRFSTGDNRPVMTIQLVWFAFNGPEDIARYAESELYYAFDEDSHVYLDEEEHNGKTYYLFKDLAHENEICVIEVGKIASTFTRTGASSVGDVNWSDMTSWTDCVYSDDDVPRE